MKVKIFLIFSSIIVFILFFSNNLKKEISDKKIKTQEEVSYNSNLMKDVNYSSKDTKGNEYIIDASGGEIDFNDKNIIYLTNVRALIKLNNSNDITITSDYGKYNTNNYDTIFSKNVIIKYLGSKIIAEYLDFSINRNSMIITKNVVYEDIENIIEADVVEINIETKDTKIFMHNSNEKVNIRSIN